MIVGNKYLLKLFLLLKFMGKLAIILSLNLIVTKPASSEENFIEGIKIRYGQ